MSESFLKLARELKKICHDDGKYQNVAITAVILDDCRSRTIINYDSIKVQMKSSSSQRSGNRK